MKYSQLALEHRVAVNVGRILRVSPNPSQSDDARSFEGDRDGGVQLNSRLRAVHQVRVSESLAVIEHGDHDRRNTEEAHFTGLWHFNR